MLDYKSIIIKRYALDLSCKELTEEFSCRRPLFAAIRAAFPGQSGPY